jgi:hypothetical protein
LQDYSWWAWYEQGTVKKMSIQDLGIRKLVKFVLWNLAVEQKDRRLALCLGFVEWLQDDNFCNRIITGNDTLYYIVTCMKVTIVGVWIGDSIYWPLIHTARNYNSLTGLCTLKIPVTGVHTKSSVSSLIVRGNGFWQCILLTSLLAGKCPIID